MNWSINIIILLLLDQVLSNCELPCLEKNPYCTEDEINNVKKNKTYGISTFKYYEEDSSIKISCIDSIEWKPCFDQITKLSITRSPCEIILHLPKLSIKILEISNTKYIKLTNKSFEETSKLMKLSLRQNKIKEIPNGVFKLLTYLEVLDLGQNEISEISNELFNGIPLKHLNLDGNKLITLNLNIPTLKYLDVSHNNLNSIIIDDLHELVHLSLDENYMTAMLNKPFKNTSMESIRFYNGELTIPDEFLTNLKHLRNVRLESLELTEVPENMIWNSSNITDLSLASNHLKELPEKFFKDSTKMKVLNLSKNNIEKINYALLKPLEQLETLDLSYNSIVQIESASLNLPKLKILILTCNNINNLLPNYLFSFENLPLVETIDLSFNKITHFDREWLILMNLKSINLADNDCTLLRVEDIQFISRNTEVDLRSNPLQVIDLSNLVKFSNAQENPKHIKPRKIYLSGNKFKCDCRNYEFAKFLHRKMPNVVYNELEINEDLECQGSMDKFSKINIESLTCDWNIYNDTNKIDNCSGCVCTYRPHDNSALMDCSNKSLNKAPEQIIFSQNINYTELNLSNNFITKLPDYKQSNIRKLNVGHNILTTINLTELPQNLEELHMEHNKLKYISDMDPTNMLTKLNHITMENNLWDCDCDKGKNTFFFINKYVSKINGSSSIPSCYLFSNLNQTYEQICPTNSVNTFYLLFAIAVLILFTFVFIILLCYKTKIDTSLYSSDFSWPTLEELLDQDKKYDAFLSFSQLDIEFVADHLVPGLEKGNMQFKLCLHNRDWVVGDFIPAQIARSIEESRKTIIVLSKNYLDSVWGLTEFRTAYKFIHSGALNERQGYIIVIIYGDIPTEDLDPELKTYISTNTYIKWGDKWFWEKLRNALLHRQETAVVEKAEILMPDKLNPPKLI